MRYLLLAVPLALLSGCIVRTGGYATYRPIPAPAAEPRDEVYYYGNHFIPDSAGGGWCYIDGPHTHDYTPDRDDWYDYDQGYYWYRGPFLFSFFGGHPLPAGGWCFINGPHQHDYYPPGGSDWRWNRSGFVYEGHYRPHNPPPASYWPRPAPRVDWRASRPSVRPAPERRPSIGPGRRQLGGAIGRPEVDDRRPAPPPDRRWEGGAVPRPEADDRRPLPAPSPDARPWPGHSGDAPGRGGNLPPGQGGVPPGHVRPELGEPPGRDRRDDDRRDRFERPAPAPSAPAPSLGRPSNDDARDKKEKKDKKEKDDKDDDRKPRMLRSR